jgi:hypothetical protein
VSILFGSGDGTFQAAQGFPVGWAPRSVAVGDFNSDKIQDLAVAGGTVSILLGNGDGSFRSRQSFKERAGISIVIEDFNGDEIQDLAVADGLSSVLVLLGNGDGTFR